MDQDQGGQLDAHERLLGHVQARARARTRWRGPAERPLVVSAAVAQLAAATCSCGRDRGPRAVSSGPSCGLSVLCKTQVARCPSQALLPQHRRHLARYTWPHCTCLGESLVDRCMMHSCSFKGGVVDPTGVWIPFQRRSSAMHEHGRAPARAHGETPELHAGHDHGASLPQRRHWWRARCAP